MVDRHGRWGTAPVHGTSIQTAMQGNATAGRYGCGNPNTRCIGNHSIQGRDIMPLPLRPEREIGRFDRGYYRYAKAVARLSCGRRPSFLASTSSGLHRLDEIRCGGAFEREPVANLSHNAFLQRLYEVGTGVSIHFQAAIGVK